MGGAMAANLAKAGHTVRGYDPHPPARKRAEEAGAATFDSPADFWGFPAVESVKCIGAENQSRMTAPDV